MTKTQRFVASSRAPIHVDQMLCVLGVLVSVTQDFRVTPMMSLEVASLLVAITTSIVMIMRSASPLADGEYVSMPATRLSVVPMLFVSLKVTVPPACAKQTTWVTQMTQCQAVTLLIVRINVMMMMTAVMDRYAKWTCKVYRPVLTPVFPTTVARMNSVMSRMADHCAAVKMDTSETHLPTIARVST